MPQHEGLSGLIATMATLRSPGGCPWDLEQTHESLVPYLLEEVFELIEALEAGTRADVKEELGDVLYQLLFHADIASADPLDPFDIDEIAQLVDQKMRTRHPHVFASGDATTVAEVSARWEEIKAEEKAQRTSVLEGIPDKLSALARAASVVKRSQAVLASHDTSEGATYQGEAELGEVLLALVASARAQGFDPERALRVATRSYEDKVIEAERAQKLAKGH
ncbi:MAG: hypothetical protein ABR66_00815 [Microbacteriaceae bacterium BACL25 MAG-120322-bin65]|jgi:XTP/dITP diphosphohydrolase|nr:MAG: hypothetical protein ABR66_00815 [Microbacteriaceae bacterium BACL25 MAG-120322-bin65]HAA80012.1 nucleoside triphosphate pyrophosphohydrolase [Microbacteriaceae bacterium]